MDSKLQQQFFDLIAKSQRVLIALPKNPNGDTLGSGLALAAFLRKLNKDVEIICETKDFGQYGFLPGIGDIKSEIQLAKNFVISVATNRASLEELSYNILPDKISIYLKPKSGVFQPEDVSFGTEAPTYNLIICVDTPSLESLGKLYEQNTEVFFNTPKVNIDNHLNNENYATLNIIDVTASSTAEILLNLLKNYEESLIDENIATNLLTGIIYETRSFQHTATSPNSFLHASELINFGARQADIITNLFKTKDLAVLKLWGRAMARIKTIPEFSTAYSAVNMADVQKSGTNYEQILKVAEDFVANISNHKLAFLAVEREDSVELFITSNPNIKLAELALYFGGEYVGEHLVRVELKDLTLDQTEAKVNEALSNLKPRLGI